MTNSRSWTNPDMVRLQKFLAECGIASRRASEQIIGAGRVAVNGEIAHVGQSVDPEKDAVTLDGKPVAREDRKVYIVLNKPRLMVTTAADPEGRRTVLDCVRGLRERVYPVGRLDFDVEGVLLLTNDGELAYRLMHPKFEVKKTYVARVDGAFSTEAIRSLERGVLLEDGMTAPAKVTIVQRGEETTTIRLTLHEGRNREVKRMCAAVGFPVLHLQRIAFAYIEAEGLRTGEWRHLTPDELATLRRITGM